MTRDHKLLLGCRELNCQPYAWKSITTTEPNPPQGLRAHLLFIAILLQWYFGFYQYSSEHQYAKLLHPTSTNVLGPLTRVRMSSPVWFHPSITHLPPSFHLLEIFIIQSLKVWRFIFAWYFLFPCFEFLHSTDVWGHLGFIVLSLVYFASCISTSAIYATVSQMISYLFIYFRTICSA